MSSGPEKNRQSDEKKHGSGANRDKPKRVALFRFGKDKDRPRSRRNRHCNSNSNSISSLPGCFGKRISGGDGGGGCFRCLKKGSSRGSPAESPTSDPNSDEFTQEMLRALIETNDFYSKECNCHGIGGI